MPYIGDVTERGSCGQVCASSPSSLFVFIQLMACSTSPGTSWTFLLQLFPFLSLPADSASPRSAPRVSPEKGAEPTASHRQVLVSLSPFPSDSIQTHAAKRSISVTRNIPVPDTPPQFAPIRRCDCPRCDEEKLGADYLMLHRVSLCSRSVYFCSRFELSTRVDAGTTCITTILKLVLLLTRCERGKYVRASLYPKDCVDMFSAARTVTSQLDQQIENQSWLNWPVRTYF